MQLDGDPRLGSRLDSIAAFLQRRRGGEASRPTPFDALPDGARDSARWFGALRVLLIVATLVMLAIISFPHSGRLAALLGFVALPESIVIYIVGRNEPRWVLSSSVAALDLLILMLAQLAAPASYAGVRFVALFLVAAHAHAQGERRGIALATATVVLLVAVGAALAFPVHGDPLAFYEFLFAVCALGSALFVGRLRTAESVGRRRMREVSRRRMETEADIRRRVAREIHDGPVQELTGLGIVIEAARRALTQGDDARAGDALAEAARLGEHSVSLLREEIVGLAPYAVGHVSLEQSLDECLPVWRRRYGIDVELSLEPLELSADAREALFQISNEAVVNAGRHSGGDNVRVRLRRSGAYAVLTVRDDGHGFVVRSPLSETAPGHIGLASMRERAELAGGAFEIESSSLGTTMTARIPLVDAATAPTGASEERDGALDGDASPPKREGRTQSPTASD